MWPNVFGPGWTWGALVALAMAWVILGGLVLMLFLLRRPKETPKPLDKIWHRFEEGDLTREEFERIRQRAQSGSRP